MAPPPPVSVTESANYRNGGPGPAQRWAWPAVHPSHWQLSRKDKARRAPSSATISGSESGQYPSPLFNVKLRSPHTRATGTEPIASNHDHAPAPGRLSEPEQSRSRSAGDPYRVQEESESATAAGSCCGPKQLLAGQGLAVTSPGWGHGRRGRGELEGPGGGTAGMPGAGARGGPGCGPGFKKAT